MQREVVKLSNSFHLLSDMASTDEQMEAEVTPRAPQPGERLLTAIISQTVPSPASLKPSMKPTSVAMAADACNALADEVVNQSAQKYALAGAVEGS